MRKYLVIYEEAVSHIWLCTPIPSELPFYIRKFCFFLTVYLPQEEITCEKMWLFRFEEDKGRDSLHWPLHLQTALELVLSILSVFSSPSQHAYKGWCVGSVLYWCSHCNKNPIYVFLFWELRSLSPNIHIHVSVRDLYIPRIGPHISCVNRSWKCLIRSQTHECGNWDWDRDIPFLGIFVSNFWHFVFAVLWCACNVGP